MRPVPFHLLLLIASAAACARLARDAHAAPPSSALATHLPDRSTPGTIVLLSDSVRVVAVPVDSAGHGGSYNFDLHVSRRGRRFTVATESYGETFLRAVAHLRRTTGWKDHYLFVRSQSGGNRWKATGEYVFALRAGRLISLGYLLALEDNKVAACWHDGWFHDVYDELEEDGYLCHQCSPKVWLRIRERDGKLVVDPDSTWADNAGIVADDDSLARVSKHSERGDWLRAIQPRIEKAVIAKYCGRSAELRAVLDETAAVIPADELARFRSELAQVRPLAMPESSRPLSPDPPQGEPGQPSP